MPGDRSASGLAVEASDSGAHWLWRPPWRGVVTGSGVWGAPACQVLGKWVLRRRRRALLPGATPWEGGRGEKGSGEPRLHSLPTEGCLELSSGWGGFAECSSSALSHPPIGPRLRGLPPELRPRQSILRWGFGSGCPSAGEARLSHLRETGAWGGGYRRERVEASATAPPSRRVGGSTGWGGGGGTVGTAHYSRNPFSLCASLLQLPSYSGGHPEPLGVPLPRPAPGALQSLLTLFVPPQVSSRRSFASPPAFIPHLPLLVRLVPGRVWAGGDSEETVKRQTVKCEASAAGAISALFSPCHLGLRRCWVAPLGQLSATGISLYCQLQQRYLGWYW